MEDATQTPVCDGSVHPCVDAGIRGRPIQNQPRLGNSCSLKLVPAKHEGSCTPSSTKNGGSVAFPHRQNQLHASYPENTPLSIFYSLNQYVTKCLYTFPHKIRRTREFASGNLAPAALISLRSSLMRPVPRSPVEFRSYSYILVIYVNDRSVHHLRLRLGRRQRPQK